MIDITQQDKTKLLFFITTPLQCHFQQIKRPHCLGLLSQFCYQYGMNGSESGGSPMAHALDDTSVGLSEALQSAQDAIVWAPEATELFQVFNR